MNTPNTQDAFTIERHGELTLIMATPALEMLDPDLEEQAAALIVEPLRRQETPLVVVDVSQVAFFGSTFLGVLLRCWKLVQSRGGTMALAGASFQTRELLRLTSLDIIWPLYADRQEAMDALMVD